MYVDDLILMTHASRKAARNIKLCFSIYENLIGQRANSSKFEIFFLTRFNKRLIRSICNILKFRVGYFPLTYLGILVSPK